MRSEGASESPWDIPAEIEALSARVRADVQASGGHIEIRIDPPADPRSSWFVDFVRKDLRSKGPDGESAPWCATAIWISSPDSAGERRWALSARAGLYGEGADEVWRDTQHAAERLSDLATQGGATWSAEDQRRLSAWDPLPQDERSQLFWRARVSWALRQVQQGHVPGGWTLITEALDHPQRQGQTVRCAEADARLLIACWGPPERLSGRTSAALRAWLRARQGRPALHSP